MQRDEFYEVLKSIAELGGGSDELMEKIHVIKEEYDNNFSKYSDSDVYSDDGIRWSEKYDDMKRRYMDRFFSTTEEVKEDQREDIRKDDESTELTFESLFKEREGDYNAD